MKNLNLWCLVPLLFGLTSAHSSERPNVLFIVVDDLNVDIASYGHPIVKTPNLDQLRERSMQFNRAYSQYPLCNPSRNSFLTGLYPGTSGNLNNADHIRDLIPDVVTLPQLFKENGYRTVSTGKIFHQRDPQSWTQISDMHTGGLLPMDRQPRFYQQGEEGRTKGPGRLIVDETVPWFEWRSVVDGEEFLKDGQIARATINRADEIAEDGVPFFLGIGFSRPHDPFFAPQRFFDMYPLDSLELPETPEGASEVPDHAFYYVFKDAFDQMDRQDKLEAMRAFYAGISYMDEQLGLVMDHLEKKGLLDNTVIVFIGDHGYQVGEKNYWNKALLFERSCRAPMLISAPGKTLEGGSTDRIVEFIDIYPTLVELCDLEAPANLDGTSLVPLLMNPDAPWHEIAYSYCNADRSVRDPRFRYIVWSGGGHALFDHEQDPGEHFNLAYNPEYATVVERMRGLIDEMPEPSKKTRPQS
ncbi:MAG: sulfatase [Verrucomicrobiota bacterium]